jgi:RodZ C-terminal domain
MKSVNEMPISPPAPEAWTPLSASSPALPASPADAGQSKPLSLPPVVSPPLTAALQGKPSAASASQVESPVVHTPLQSQQSSRSALYRLRVRAHAKTWLQITIDGRPLKRVFLDPSQSQEWLAKKGFTLSLGNAGAVKLTLDGHELPPLGKAGQKVLNVRLPSRQRSQRREMRNAARPHTTKPR